MALLDPYTGPWTALEAAHLARRAGFGLRSDELAALVGLGMGAAVDRYVDFQPTDAALESLIASLPDDTTTDLGKIKHPSSLSQIGGYWVYRMVHTTQPLQEQLALFFHDTLVSEYDKVNSGVPFAITYGNDGSQAGQSCTGGNVVPGAANQGIKTSQLMLDQLALFRTDGPGPYRQLMRKITRNPAMLLYLDNFQNVKGRANENYGREVMELFTMGVGNYSEADVQAVARAFTGESVDYGFAGNYSMAYKFNAAQHDSNPKIVFGQTFNNAAPSADTDYVLDLILGRISGAAITPYHSLYPATAIFISWKLLTWFVLESMDIGDPAVGELAAYFAATVADGDVLNIREALRKLLKSQIFYDAQYRWAMYKNPADFVALALRNLQIEESSYSGSVLSAVRSMGMTLFDPPNVAGWRQGQPWINSSNMIARFNYGDRLSGSGRLTGAYADNLLSSGAIASKNDHAGMIEYFRARLIQDTLSTAEQQPLLDFLTGIGDATNGTSKYYSKIRGLVHLFMSMPRYQLK